MTREPIVIVGFGWVGQANAIALSRMGYDVSFFDPGKPAHHYAEKYEKDYESIKRLSSPLELDSKNTVYIVSVGDRVDEAGNQDISLIRSALSGIKDAQGTVILRSTVLPNHLKTLKFDIYLPEFLHEKYAVEECLIPHYFVVGKKESGMAEPSFFPQWRARSFKSIDCTSEEASHIKYLSNIWNALRIAFVNEFGRSIHSAYHENEYRDEVKSLKQVSKVLGFLFENKPYLQYGRAYTGHCLPKDMRAYTKYSENHINPTFLKGVMESNKEQEKFEAVHHELKEFFSSWRRIEMSGRAALEALFRAIKRRILSK